MPAILKEDVGSILPIGDAVLLIIGLYVTKLRPFNICELGMMAFESLSAPPHFIIANSSFHGCTYQNAS